MEASSYKMHLGDPIPSFALPGADGRTWSLSDFAKKPVLVIAFTCNHCPYVQAYEDRIMDLQRHYGPRGAQVVAINANETRNYPEDDLPHMVERAKAKGFNFPYLRDETQKVAEAFGAVCTPHFLVFDVARRLRYQGRLDDDKDGKNVRQRYLADAIDDLLSEEPVRTPETWAIGCSIKWDKL